MKRQISFYIFILIALLRPVISLLSNRFSNLTDIHMIILLGLVVLYLFFVEAPVNHNLLFALLFFIVFIINTIIFPRDIYRNLSDFARMSIIYGVFMMYKDNELFYIISEYIDKYYKILLTFIGLLSIYIIYEIVMRKNFFFEWGDYYYKSVFRSQHVFAFFLILMISISFALFRIKKNIICLVSVGVFITGIFLSGARSAFIVAIIMIAYAMFNFIKFDIKRVLIAFFVLLSISFVIYRYVDISNISLVKKSIRQYKYSDIFSGRFEIWEVDLKYFSESSLAQKLIGNGSSFTFRLHQSELNSTIWSHNDFVNILLTTGIVGLMIYLYFVLYNIKSINKTINITNSIMFGLLYIFSAFFNGFYNYGDLICSLFFLRIIMHRKSIEKEY